MIENAKAVMNTLLKVDLYNSAYNLDFIKRPKYTLTYNDVCEAIQILNELSLYKDEESKNLFIGIAALLWEHSNTKFYGLRDVLIVLLSRIGYAPSSVILDDTYNQDKRFQQLESIISQWETTLNHRRYQINIRDKVFLLTDFQYNIWTKLKTSKLTGISAPTSAGKSFVLLLESVRLIIEENYDIIYIVPTLSLVNQVTEDYISLFKQLNYTEYEVLNSYNEDLLSSTIPQIFILTQERAIAAFSISKKPFNYTSMLIVDEIQNIERIAEEGSEMRSKILLDAIFEFRFLKSIDRIVISGPRISEIDVLAEKLFGRDNEAIATDISPVLNITYGIEKANDKYYFKQYCSVVDKPSKLLISNSGSITGHNKKQYTEEFLNYLITFVQKMGNGCQNIIFSPTSTQARQTAIAISENIEFKNEALNSLSDYLKETVHDNYSLANIIVTGTAYHHGKLPAHVRKVVEKAITEKLLNNVTCTTTLMQGVNMPAQNIIIRNPHLYTKKKKNSAELSSYEMANLRGRAGRLLKDFIGRTYVLDENEFLTYSDEYVQETLFDNTYKELNSNYQTTFEEYRTEINDALDNQYTSNVIPEAYRHIVIHIRQAVLRHGDNARYRLNAIGINLTEREFADIKSALENLMVPKEICIRNRYWDPLVLDILYQDENLPPVPRGVAEKGIKAKLYNLLKYLRDNENYAKFFQERIPDKYRKGKTLSILCESAAKWAKELTLKEILNNKYNEDPDNIEETISLLQKTIAFDLPIL